MTKEEKVRYLVELCALDKNLVEHINAIFPPQDAEDEKFTEFLFEKLVENHIKVFNDKFSESRIDELIAFFANQNLQNSLKLLNQISEEVLRMCDVDVSKYLEEEELKEHIKYEADKGEVN